MKHIIFLLYAVMILTSAQAEPLNEESIEGEVEIEESALDPITSPPGDDIVSLKAHIQALQKELQLIKQSLPQTGPSAQTHQSSEMQHKDIPATSLEPTPPPAAPSVPVIPAESSTRPAPASIPIQSVTSPSAALDEDVSAILSEMKTPSILHAPNSEAKVLGEPNTNAQPSTVLHDGALFETFHDLKNQFEAIARHRESPSFKADAQSFIHECRAYVDAHQRDATGRSALYLCARMMLVLSQLKEAQKAFAQVYKGDEDGPHAAEALLGMAEVLLVQGQKPAAIKFLEKVRKDFPKEYLTQETQDLFAHVAQQAQSSLQLRQGSQKA